MPDLEVFRPRRSSLWQRAKRSLTLGPFNLKDRELSRFFSEGRQTTSGVPVNEYTAMNYAAVWAAVNLVSEQIASVPLKLYKRVETGKESFDAHPLYRLLHDRPNPYMSSAVFRRQLQANRMVWGNGYAEIERDSAGRPFALWPLLPSQVMPYYAKGGILQYRVANPDGGTLDFSASDILHIRGLSSCGDGTVGDSMIPYARESLGLGIASERFGGAFFGNGSTFGGVITYPPGVGGNEQVRKENREALEKRHQGVDRAHRFLALYEGATYAQLGVPPNAAQFIETREFQIEEVCRWFNVPPHKLKHLKRSTNNNIEQQAIEFVTDCLNPHWTIWEEELSAKLIAPSERNIQIIEHVRAGLLQGDTVSRGDYYSKTFFTAAITPNEIRSLENMNEIAGGDAAFVSLQSIPVDLARDYWQGQIDERQAKIEALKNPPAPPVVPPPPSDPTASEQKAWEEAILEARKRAQAAEDAADVARAERDAARAEQARAEQIGDTRVVTLAALLKHEEQCRKDAEAATVAAEGAREACAAERDAALLARDQAEQKRVSLAEALHAMTGERNEARAALAASDADLWAVAACADDLAIKMRAAEAGLDDVRRQLAAVISERDAAAQRATDAVTERETAIAAAAAASVAHAEEVETLTHLRRTAEQDREAARAAAAAATADLSAALETIADMTRAELAQADKVTAAQTEADALRMDLAQARAEVAAELERASRQRAMLLASMRSLFVDASKRLLQKESDRARKHQQTPEKLRAWVDHFYPLHAVTCRAVFQPLVGPWVALSGMDGDALLDRLVADHVDASQRAIRLVLDVDDADEMAGALERTLMRWESERADAMADALVREGMQHG